MSDVMARTSGFFLASVWPSLLLAPLLPEGSPGLEAQTDPTRIDYRVVTEMRSIRAGEPPVVDTTFSTVWLAEGRLALLTDSTVYLVEETTATLTVASHNHETFIRLPLPLKLGEALTPLARFRFHTDPLLEARPIPDGGVDARDALPRLMAPVPQTLDSIFSSCEPARWQMDDVGSRTLSLCSWNQNLISGTSFTLLSRPLLRFLYPGFSERTLDLILATGGIPRFWEETVTTGGRQVRVTLHAVSVSREPFPPDSFLVPSGYKPRPRLRYRDLLAATSGPPEPGRDEREEEVRETLRALQAGYLCRDPATVEAWVHRLFAPDVEIVGTNSVFPGDFEWRKGRDAAVEMFGNDWERWGDLTVFPDDAEITVLRDVAWISMAGVVRRDPSQGDRYRWPEDSRRASLARIRDYTDSSLESRLSMYEILADAAQVLVEYERSEEFLWPLRMTFLMTRVADRWEIRQLHWSLPGRGFPGVRRFPNELATNPSGGR